MDVVGIDKPIMDLLLHTEKMPEANGFSELIEYGWQGGNKVSTALVTLGRLGIETGVIGVVGGDAFGRFCIDDFKRHGVDTSRMTVDAKGATTLCVCISESKTQGRSFLGSGGTCRDLSVDDLDKEYICSARYLHLSTMSQVTSKAAQWARESGGKIVFDADYPQPELFDSLHLIDVFIASEFVYHALFKDDHFEENCRSIIQKGPEIAVFTFGEKGCLGMDKEGFFQIPAYKVDVVDTTGAGDVFHGAFIYGLLKGWNTGDTARFASAVSAIKCTRVGGRAGIPDLETTQRFMKDGYIDYTDIDGRVEFYRNAHL